MNEKQIYVGPMMEPVKDLCWYKPRNVVEDEYYNKYREDIHFGDDYFIGMDTDESAFIAGMLRKRQPRKILEVGFNKGGTTLVLLEALRELEISSEVYSVDLDDGVAGKGLLSKVSDDFTNLTFWTGRDVSAYLDEIGGDIDFCILDSAHFLPGELLNFLCVLPYLKNDAMVIVHDQIHQFDVDVPYVKFLGSESVISCRVLVDTVSAKKVIPNFGDKAVDSQKAPNIAAFEINEKTRENVRDIFSALMLPWRFLPGKDYLADVMTSLTANFHEEYVSYFRHTIHKQMQYHLARPASGKLYWELVMKSLQEKNRSSGVAFFGAGGFCKKLIEEILPSNLCPDVIIDSKKSSGNLFNIPIMNISEALKDSALFSAIVITSNAHHSEIERELKAIEGLTGEIINPFVFPLFETKLLFR